MTVVRLSSQDLSEFAKAREAEPAVAKLQDLQVARAKKLGGLTLQVYRLNQGLLFGEPIMMTADEVASRLNLPVSTIVDHLMKVDDPALREWFQTSEFQTSRYAQQRP
jgi:hypothetical protein